MRLFMRLAIGLLLSGFGLTAAFAAQPEAAACRELVYAANPSYPPYHWAEGESAYAGASVELLALALPPGVRARPVVLPWRRTLEWARQGKVDLILSLRITPERTDYLLFTAHRSFSNPIVVFVRRDRVFPFKQWADLKGRRGGVSFGDRFGNGFDEYWRAELTVEEAPTMESNFAKLEAGRIDYFVTSRYVGEAYAGAHTEGHGVTVLAPPISDEGIHFGFSKASPCAALARLVDARLKELDRKGVSEQLLKKHLRRYLEQSGAQPPGARR
ncbi:MAG: amino acid ABC transporter substrate-binding protein [Desulfovibrio sp.]|jgi:polar amino acid transport system substrate-binding protein|nr:amino acid ABC transporter substrate-binding protein [Desulfovibrio sp.]